MAAKLDFAAIFLPLNVCLYCLDRATAKSLNRLKKEMSV